MTLWHDIPISLTAEDVLAEQGRRRKMRPHPALTAAAEEALALSRELIAPAALLDEFAVERVTDAEIVLRADGTRPPPRLTVGPKVDLLAPAARLAVAVYTIGPALERRVGELVAAGKPLLAYMLDAVGVLALGAVGEALRRRIEERAAERGWGVSPALSPGSLVGWALQGQRQVCNLLPLDEIGVRLNARYVLEPHKSVSMVVGLGPGYESAHVGSVCRYCSLVESCWRRREGPMISS